MPVARPERQEARVIAHIDLDCFYVQVEQRNRPELRGKPTAVVQYNTWKGGGLIAVGYEARKFGVKRSMRGDEAKEACPDICLVQVPVARGKADLTLYRDAGSEVVSILAKKGKCERASIDEVYLDITDAANKLLSEGHLQFLDCVLEEVLGTHILGVIKDSKNQDAVRNWLFNSDADHKDRLLASGAFIVAELRLEVLARTQFTCSAGVAHNKMLAKLASGMHKPAQQTVVPATYVPSLLSSLPVKKMKQLGGKLGSSLETDLGIHVVGDLLQFSESKLQELYGVNTGTWLWNIARGISGDEVKERLLPKSQGCGKTFPGSQALRTFVAVEQWLSKLSEELNDRIQADLMQNKRIAHQLTLHVRAYQEKHIGSSRKFPSKSCSLRYGKEKILQDAVTLFERGLREYCGSSKGEKRLHTQKSAWAISGLSIIASNIQSTVGVNPITSFFTSPSQAASSGIHSSSCESYLFGNLEESIHQEAERYVSGRQSETYISEGKGEDGVCSDLATGTDKCLTSIKEGLNDENVLPLPTSEKMMLGLNSNLNLSSNNNDSWNLDDSHSVNENHHCSNVKEIQSEQSVASDEDSMFQNDLLKSSRQHSNNWPSAAIASHTKKRVKNTAVLRLDDMWKKSSNISCSESTSQKRNVSNWLYDPREIDESTFRELPVEIQQELQSDFKLKRSNTLKHPTIGHYFKSI